ncbi:MAG: hypothetical protein OEY41_13050, partial [Acidimicrobiia bacterium]|nr:hypothetical protein [Acidimicrobiia bacterium]
MSEAADPVDEAVTVVCDDSADESEDDEPQPASATAATITTEEYPSFTAVPSVGYLRHSVVIVGPDASSPPAAGRTTGSSGGKVEGRKSLLRPRLTSGKAKSLRIAAAW